MEVALRFAAWFFNALRADYPAQRPPFLADRILQQVQALQESVGARWAARHVDIDKNLSTPCTTL